MSNLAHTIDFMYGTQSSDFGLESRVSITKIHQTSRAKTNESSVSSSSHPVFAIKFGSQIRPLVKPVVLRVSKQGELFFAENETFDIHADGSNPMEAINDALEEISYLIGYYASLSESDVIGYGAIMREKFSNLLVG